MESLILINSEDEQPSHIELSSSSLRSEDILQVSSPEPVPTFADMSQSVTFSPYGGTSDLKNEIVENFNLDTVCMLEQNMYQGTLTPAHDDDDGRIGIRGLKEEADRDSDNFPGAVTSNKNSHNNKPGVILLGRGNSFSLGRSEVMLLHASRRNRTNSRRVDNSNYLSSIEDTDNAQNNNNIDVQNWNDFNLNEINSVTPQVNNRPPAAVTTSNKKDGKPLLPGELEMLWQKAELIMAAKETVVQQVLEEFGIGDSGAVGDESVDRMMEETIWQAVQENFSI